MKVQHWVAGRNVPGYLPENPPMHGGTLAEALAYVRDDLEEEHGMCLEHEDRERDAVMEAILVVDKLGDDTGELVKDAELERGDRGHWSIVVGPWVFWIQPCHKVDCDQVETDDDE